MRATAMVVLLIILMTMSGLVGCAHTPRSTERMDDASEVGARETSAETMSEAAIEMAAASADRLWVGVEEVDPQTRATTPGRELAIHFLDVGQGDSTLIVCPDGRKILVDSGALPYPETHRIEAIRQQLRGYLDADDPKIDTVIVTHQDQDHYNLLPTVLRGVIFDRLILIGGASQYVDKDHSEPPRYHNAGTWLRRLREDYGWKVTLLDRVGGVPYRDPEGGPSPLLPCGDAEIWILAAEVREDDDFPDEDEVSANNTRSIVLKVTYGEFDAILTGDATSFTERAVMNHYSAPFVDIELLKIGHHGSTTSTAAAWADATSPEIAVVSSGYWNPHAHPRHGPLKRLEPYTRSALPHGMRWFQRWRNPPDDTADYREAIFSTATNGVVSVYSDGSVDVNGEVDWHYVHD